VWYKARMTEEPDNLILQYLRKFDAKLDAVGERMRSMEARFGALESRFSAMEERMAGVERRLGLIEA
jgi:phage shock protein A